MLRVRASLSADSDVLIHHGTECDRDHAVLLAGSWRGAWGAVGLWLDSKSSGELGAVLPVHTMGVGG